jgi:hypothetical protein
MYFPEPVSPDRMNNEEFPGFVEDSTSCLREVETEFSLWNIRGILRPVSAFLTELKMQLKFKDVI